MQPVIKYTGSKRLQAKEIVDKFPKEIDIYYEPFIGGGSILIELLQRKDIKVKKYICSDINKDLIHFWILLKDNPTILINHYTLLWTEMKSKETIEEKKNFFNKVRDRLNKEHNAADFLFVSRTAINGLIRYNKKGEFNSSLHLNRDGINPKTLEKIILQWYKLLSKVDIEFIIQDYKVIQTKENDFIYLDPPYMNTNGMYFGGISFNEFTEWLEKQQCKYLLSYDGKRETKDDIIDNTQEIPKHLYSKHIYIYSGQSSFNKLKKQKEKVYESLYIK